MGQPRRRARLDPEPLEEALVCHQAGRQHLDRDQAAEHLVDRPPQRGHAAAAAGAVAATRRR
ncbi:MAG TPA: hypothetical protein VFA45_09490 [Actinomycetes bacterium]|nr:hypothetical protein [Actinomycetes bacterium]